MKNKTLLMGCLIVAFSGVSQAAIVAGDALAIDFGSTVATVVEAPNWNTGVVASVADLTVLGSGAASGVGLTVGGIGGTPVNNNAVFESVGGSSIFNIYDDGIILNGNGDDQINLTFTGLDDSLTYNLFGGGDLDTSFGGTVVVDGQTIVTSNALTHFSFTGLSTDGSGNLAITINDVNNGGSPTNFRNVGISELTLTAAVPEPSSSALLGLGGLALLARRRR